MEIYCAVLLFFGCYCLFFSVANVRWMRIHTSKPERKSGPFVSVLIPVRNEEKNIGKCLESLLDQTYENYEILVLNDGSTDTTELILARFEKKYPGKIRTFRGKDLPSGWYGKPHAMSQLAEMAGGQYLLFTDADTVHNPDSISWAVTNIEKNGCDFVSGYAGQDLLTFGEKTTVPLVFMLTGFIIPLWLNYRVKSPVFASAIGQYIAVRAESLKGAGGCETVKCKTGEDVYLARRMKQCGYRTCFLDIKDQVHCRMYEGYEAAIRGIGKNIFDFLGKHSFILLAAVAAVFLFLFLPFPLFWIMLFTGSQYTVYMLIVCVLYFLTWFILCRDRGLKWFYAFLWPVFFANLLIMAMYSWFNTISGKGFEWKGRTVH